MKINKILAEVMKAYNKNPEKFPNLVALYNYNIDTLAVLFDSYRVFLVPRDLFIFDPVKVTRGRGEASERCMRWIWKQEADAEPAVLTREREIAAHSFVVKLKSKHTHAWVNTDFLKMYEKGAKYKILGPKKPIFVYEEEKLVSVVLPVNMGKETEK